jgi:hypothetical protein
MRRAALLAAFALSGCIIFRGQSSESTDFFTTLSPDSALRVAATQLEQAGFQIGARADNTIMTRTRALDQEVNVATLKKPARHWMLRVDAMPDTLTRRTRVVVQGYAVPELPAGSAAGTTTTIPPDLEVAPITTNNRRLFKEIETVTNSIRNASNQKAKGG